MKVGKLSFKALEIDGRASISTDLTDDEARGIYAYEFSDGTWYVGKSVDVRDRHVQHMHEYRHMDPPLHASKMLWATFSGTDQQLDFAESEAIAWFESKGYDLRNKMKTGRPGGSLEVVVDTGEGWGVPIPWDRDRIPPSTREFAFEEQPRMKEKFQKLQDLPEYDGIIDTLAWYVNNTIPAPADTAGSLWVATAMPQTYGRICCITCQNVEALVLFEDGAFDKKGPWGFINAKPDADMMVFAWSQIELSSYTNLRNCIAYTFDDLDAMNYALSSDRMLDCCYRVNSELMRKGASMMKRYNNPYLIEAILERPLPPFREQVEDEHAFIVSSSILDPSKDVESVRLDETTVPTTVYVLTNSKPGSSKPTGLPCGTVKRFAPGAISTNT